MKMNFLKTAASTFFTIGTVGALSIVPATSAHAVYRCADNEICFYKDSFYSGTAFVPREMIYPNSSIPDFRTRTFTDGTNANNQVSSIVNNTGWCLLVYTGLNFLTDDGRDVGMQVKPDSAVDVGTSTYNDKISSARFIHGLPGCP